MIYKTRASLADIKDFYVPLNIDTINFDKDTNKITVKTIYPHGFHRGDYVEFRRMRHNAMRNMVTERYLPDIIDDTTISFEVKLENIITLDTATTFPMSKVNPNRAYSISVPADESEYNNPDAGQYKIYFREEHDFDENTVEGGYIRFYNAADGYFYGDIKPVWPDDGGELQDTGDTSSSNAVLLTNLKYLNTNTNELTENPSILAKDFITIGPFCKVCVSNTALYMIDGDIVKLREGTTLNKVTGYVHASIPVASEYRVDLGSTEDIKENYIKNVENALIPDSHDMEKNIYLPVIDGTKYFADKIVFNFHFRERDKNWITRNDTTEHTYYWNNMTEDDLGKDPNGLDYYAKSDTLDYLDFDDNDIHYQRNGLKKSFLRLMFYNSINPLTQKLLFYSSIWVDSGELFGLWSGLRSVLNADEAEISQIVPIDITYETYKDAQTAEAKKQIISNVIDADEGRLSSQIVITNKYDNTKSSEGFYLYLFQENFGDGEEHTIYMKAEYNQAKDGKSIPLFMFRDKIRGGYLTVKDGKLNTDMSALLEDQYIEVKVKYNTDLKAYTWSIPKAKNDSENFTITLNLFEPKLQGFLG